MAMVKTSAGYYNTEHVSAIVTQGAGTRDEITVVWFLGGQSASFYRNSVDEVYNVFFGPRS